MTTEESAIHEMETRPAMVLVKEQVREPAKEQAKWQIVAFQNIRISEMPAVAQAARRLAT